MFSNQIDGGEGVAPPPRDKLFPSRREPRRLSSLVQLGWITVGRRRLSASAACLLGKQTDLEIFLLKRPLNCKRLGASPGSFLTQSVFQRVHHHLVDQQVPLIGSEGEKHECDEFNIGAPPL